ncbi:nucleotidyl transferase AbiEii/AbiGii toxin family protein [Myxococcus faecalis]|uniref:nucleotidyl transferase AbiEii/AbiGii toxin family protein n=1 Tax=Myxococcus faecalis TaxID=3115646 RepID=UPI003CF4F84C
MASSQSLRSALAFKGGNALDFVWQPNRSTLDLDFSSTAPELNEVQLDARLAAALSLVGRQLGISFRVHSVKRNPPGPDSSFVTFEARVGYALSDDQRNTRALFEGRSSTLVIPVEVSINEPVCSTEEVDVRASHRLRVCTLEDIVSEKLRSLLQQPIRNRQRRQDLLDIAVTLKRSAELDPERIARFLNAKAAARNVPVSRAAFRDERVRDMARKDYDALKSTTRELFIPFEEAYSLLQGFVASLPIPDALTSTST